MARFIRRRRRRRSSFRLSDYKNYEYAGPNDGRYLQIGDAFDDDQVTMIDDTYENHACCRTIRSYHSVRCPKEGERAIEAIDPAVLLIGSAILIVCGVVKSLFRSMEDHRGNRGVTNRWTGCLGFLQSLPEAAGCMLVGAAAGVIVRIAVLGIDLDRVAFDDDRFLSILLRSYRPSYFRPRWRSTRPHCRGTSSQNREKGGLSAGGRGCRSIRNIIIYLATNYTVLIGLFD